MTSGILRLQFISIVLRFMNDLEILILLFRKVVQKRFEILITFVAKNRWLKAGLTIPTPLYAVKGVVQ